MSLEKFSLRTYFSPETSSVSNISNRTFQILFYALRPTFVRTQTLTSWHVLNILAILSSDYVIYTIFGPTPLVYFLFSSFFAGSLHPCAGHFIAEHYLWDGQDQETYSYYGWWNIVAYNVGYHNEHHDFPSVPWTRLPKLRKLAPEYYDELPAHPSWPMVIVNFIRDPEVGIFARAKRVPTGSSTVAPPRTEKVAEKGEEEEGEDKSR